jgi:hypothetical protein
MRFPAAPRDLAERPLLFMVNKRPEAWLFGNRLYGVVTRVPVAVTRPTTLLRIESPVSWRTGFGGYSMLAIDGIESIHWPKDPAVASLIHANAEFRPEGLSLRTRISPAYEFKLEVPDAPQVASAILASRGWNWQISDKGKYAQALLEVAGDLVSVLASQRALMVGAALASLSRPKAEQRLRRLNLANVDAEVVVRAVADTIVANWLRSRPVGEIAGDLGLPKRSVLPILESLVSAGLVRRGFRFDCPRCGLSSSIGLGQVDDRVECPGCRTPSVLTGSAAGEEPTLVYSLNSLLDRAFDQDCVSHTLTALWAAQHADIIWAVPGALVTDSDGNEREVDFLGISREAMVVGELKATAIAIDEPLALDMIDLARRLGATRLVLGTPDEWSEEAREDLATRVQSADVAITMIGGSELLPGA